MSYSSLYDRLLVNPFIRGLHNNFLTRNKNEFNEILRENNSFCPVTSFNGFHHNYIRYPKDKQALEVRALDASLHKRMDTLLKEIALLDQEKLYYTAMLHDAINCLFTEEQMNQITVELAKPVFASNWLIKDEESTTTAEDVEAFSIKHGKALQMLKERKVRMMLL